VPNAEAEVEETVDAMSLLGGRDSDVDNAAEGVVEPQVSDEVQSELRRS
jgi:hypothetical protein